MTEEEFYVVNGHTAQCSQELNLCYCPRFDRVESINDVASLEAFCARIREEKNVKD